MGANRRGKNRGAEPIVQAMRPALDELMQLAADDGVELSEMAFLIGLGALRREQLPPGAERRYRANGRGHVARVDRAVFEYARRPALYREPGSEMARRIADEIRAIDAGPEAGDAVLIVRVPPVFCVGTARMFGVQVARPTAPDPRSGVLRAALATYADALCGVVIDAAREQGVPPSQMVGRVMVMDPAQPRPALHPPGPGEAGDYPLDISVARREHAVLDPDLPRPIVEQICAEPTPGHAWFIAGGFQRLCVFEMDLSARLVSVRAVGQA